MLGNTRILFSFRSVAPFSSPPCQGGDLPAARISDHAFRWDIKGTALG